VRNKILLEEPIDDLCKKRMNELKTNIAFSLSKIDETLDKIISNTSTIHDGSNSFFEKKGQVLQKAYFLIPLDLGISKADYTPYNCAYNGNNLVSELTSMCEMLPP
jgi:hypothetical protein